MTNPTLDEAVAKAAEWRSMTSRVKNVIVSRLDLPIPADWITDDQPLFGRGLELDSLDALELSMAADQEFNTPMYEEDTANFGSVSSFIQFMLDKLPGEDRERLPPTNGIALAMRQVRAQAAERGDVEVVNLADALDSVPAETA